MSYMDTPPKEPWKRGPDHFQERVEWHHPGGAIVRKHTEGWKWWPGGTGTACADYKPTAEEACAAALFGLDTTPPGHPWVVKDHGDLVAPAVPPDEWEHPTGALVRLDSEGWRWWVHPDRICIGYRPTAELACAAALAPAVLATSTSLERARQIGAEIQTILADTSSRGFMDNALEDSAEAKLRVLAGELQRLKD